MKIVPELKVALNNLTKWSKHGKVEVIKWDDYAKREKSLTESYEEFLGARGIHFQPAPGCIVVDYDFCDDEVTDEEKDEFEVALSSLWDGLQAQGEPAYDFDGSGGGLYYGMNIYKPN